MIISGKGKLDITIKAPPSKSVYHRELIIRFLAGDRNNLQDLPDDSDDIKATRACLRSMAEAGTGDVVTLSCKESGSTLRFMIPVASAFLLKAGSPIASKLIFKTEGRLFDRPLKELSEAMEKGGIIITKNENDRTIEVTGNMKPGSYEIDGSVSSQYISGLLMALTYFASSSCIKVTGEMKSVHYIELTTDALLKYGSPVKTDGNTFYPCTRGYPKYIPEDFEVEGDWSNGAFLLCLKEWSDIEVTNLDPDSRQGDKAIVDFLKFAHDHEEEKDLTWDCTDTPDIAPYMAVVAPFFFGKLTLTGIGRLRIKESDRVKAVRDQLSAIGVRTEETEDSLTVYRYESTEKEQPIKLSSYHDHRMAMCAILIAVILKAEVDIDDLDCLNKSFPQLREITERELMP
ncbi:MAG: 3-phosphoshikimate 1-carboxyvinyltransferase [Clostridiales bacterium]|nr:3-phosphoshikimate 1-carboxyvinyltransferase [Clostridiales bacterium]